MRRSALLLIGLLLGAAIPLGASQDANSTEPSPTPARTSVDAPKMLFTLAAIIGLGFLGFIIFDRYRIADTIFLVGFGVLLSAAGFLDAELFRSFQPLVVAFAILIIVFDAGLDLRFGDLALPKMGWAITFSTIGFVATVSLVSAVGHYLLHLPWLLAGMLGCAVADTAGVVILPIISQLGAPGKVRTALLVETSLPDAYAVALVLALMNIAQPAEGAAAGTIQTTASDLLGNVATTVLLGLLTGFLWVQALQWLATRRYAYMTTLAAVLGLNWLVDALGGSGPLAVLLFGIVIGNRALLGKWLDLQKAKVFRDMIQFNGEVAFLVRSFFFVYLGVILDVDLLTRDFVTAALLIVAAIVAGRGVATYTMTAGGGAIKQYRGLLMAAIPRGTTAAVVSTLPATRGIEGTQAFAAYAVAVILATNLIFTIGLYLFFRPATKPADEEETSKARSD